MSTDYRSHSRFSYASFSKYRSGVLESFPILRHEMNPIVIAGLVSSSYWDRIAASILSTLRVTVGSQEANVSTGTGGYQYFVDTTKIVGRLDIHLITSSQAVIGLMFQSGSLKTPDCTMMALLNARDILKNMISYFTWLCVFIRT